MPNKNIIATQRADHNRTDFAGIGALEFPVAILRSEHEFATTQRAVDSIERSEWRRQNDFGAGWFASQCANDLPTEKRTLSLIAMHLPIGDNQGSSHGWSSSALIPGNILP